MESKIIKGFTFGIINIEKNGLTIKDPVTGTKDLFGQIIDDYNDRNIN
jgi:hypothetical protein